MKRTLMLLLVTSVLILCLPLIASSQTGPPPLTPGNILVSTTNYPWGPGYSVHEYTTSGARIQSIDVPFPGDRPFTESVRDVVVDRLGNVQVYNGTITPWLSSYTPSTGNWQHNSFAGWSTVDSDGGVASFQGNTYVTDMFTYDGGEAQGLIWFRPGFAAERFATDAEFSDLTIGLDGLLYALEGNGYVIRVYNPLSALLVRQINLPFGIDLRAIAVNQAGHIFGASWGGQIHHYDANGNQLASLWTGFSNLIDIDINVLGELVVGSRFGPVVLTNESLGTLTSFQAGLYEVFVAFTDPVFHLSGRVTDGAGVSIPGVTVTLSGARSATATTDPLGYYSLGSITAGESHPIRTTASHRRIGRSIRPAGT